VKINMAFDRHIEADQVGDDDLGLFSSIIARPILWLLGGDQDKNEEKRKEEKKKIERDILEASDVSEDGLDDGNGDVSVRYDGGAESSTEAAKRDYLDIDMKVDAGGEEVEEQHNRSSHEGGDEKKNSNQIFHSSLPSWPRGGAMDSCDEEDINIFKAKPMNGSPRRRDNCSPSTQIVDDLVAVMESSTIDPRSRGPATSAMASRCELSSSANSLSASHSASAFPNHQLTPNIPLHNSHSSNSKKTSWSDEHGSRPLVEYSDDLETSSTSKHWTQLRRKKRRNSYDGEEKRPGTRRSQVRVIKSALRSGSYSPPVTMMCARGGLLSSSASTSSASYSSNQTPPAGGERSFHSLSMIGSSSSSSISPDPFSVATNSNDSLAAVTSRKLSVRDDVECVPSTLKQGGGRANEGLIIPRGGPSAAYHLTLGTRVGSERQDRVSAKENQAEGVANAPTNANSCVNNVRMQVKGPSPHHHMFLPHPPNGYVSPQYGFYVNITPPTPIHAATKRGSPLRPFEESSPQQQSYKQFNTFPPSPIPEVEIAKEKGAGPSLGSFSKSVDAPDERSKLKPSFPKNRVGMGMVLAGNHHHHAWPSIPMG
jgi:hypothetical protein